MILVRAYASSLFALAIFFVTTHARAQGNDFSAPTGGRTTLMGGTGVALGRDGAAPFLNPAGIVRIEDQRLAFSVNFYTLGFTHYSNFHQPGLVDTNQVAAPGATGLTTSSFRVLPSTLCLFFTIGDIQKVTEPNAPPIPPDRVMRRKLAICFAQVENDDVGLQAVQFQANTALGPTAQTAALSRGWNRTYFGPTFSQYVTDRLAIGASLDGIYSHDTYSFASSSISSKVGGGALASSLAMSGSGYSMDLTAILGVTYFLSDTVTVGLSARAPSLHLLGSYNGSFSQTSTNGNTGDTATIANGAGAYRAWSPLRIGTGIGFEWPKLRLEGDAALIVPVASSASAAADVTTTTLSGGALTQKQTTESYAVESLPMVNPALGIEYFIRNSFSVVGGAAMNLSTLERLTPQPGIGNLVEARTNEVSGSLGIGSYSNRKELLIGVNVQYGWGDAIVANPYVVPNDWATVSTNSITAMFVISGSTDLRSIENAVVKVRNTVETGDPNKPPPPKKNENPPKP